MKFFLPKLSLPSLFVVLLFVLSACSESKETNGQIKPELGKNYIELSQSFDFQKPAKHEVLEFFSYLCVHCFRSQDSVNQFIANKNEDTNLIKIPVIFGNNPLFNQIFYTFQELGDFEHLHPLFFNAIHVEKLNFKNAEDFFAWMQSKGYSIDQVRNVFNSSVVKIKTTRSYEQLKQYQINSTPTFIIDGKYKTGPAMTKSHENTMKIIAALTDNPI